MKSAAQALQQGAGTHMQTCEVTSHSRATELQSKRSDQFHVTKKLRQRPLNLLFALAFYCFQLFASLALRSKVFVFAFCGLQVGNLILLTATVRQLRDGEKRDKLIKVAKNAVQKFEGMEIKIMDMANETETSSGL
jgi:hypothetical protein